MSLQQLIELSNIRDLDQAGYERLQQARQRQREYDKKIEQQVANKRVGPELLARTCSI
jgi:hypothetical protein